MNGIQNQQPPVPNFLSKEEEDLLKRTILKTFAEDEQLTFIRICQRTHLDPFTKQIYATRRYQKVRDETTGDTRKVATLVPVTGIMGLTAVADRTGQYDGCEIWWSGPDGMWQTEWLKDEYPAAAKCIVHHKHRRPETAIARWNSYVGQAFNYQTKEWEVSDFWHKMPDYMLGKVAKAAALRGAFPSPLSNLYIREELDSNITDAEETESIPADQAKIAENQRREAELRDRPLPAGIKLVESKKDQPPRPTPAEALEPAFESDKIPPRATTPAAPIPHAVEPPPQSSPQQPSAVQEGPQTEITDDLDMTPAPAAPAAQPPAPWRDHVIKGVKRFNGRKIGDLDKKELRAVEEQWIPRVRELWDQTNQDQREDYTAFEAAIAFFKMEAQKPW
jgi:phage recombination protein Bet